MLRGILIQTVGHSVSGSFSNLEISLIFTQVYSETTSLAYLDMPGNRNKVSGTLAATIRDAEYCTTTRVVFDAVSAQCHSSLTFCKCSALSECFKWQKTCKQESPWIDASVRSHVIKLLVGQTTCLRSSFGRKAKHASSKSALTGHCSQRLRPACRRSRVVSVFKMSV